MATKLISAFVDATTKRVVVYLDDAAQSLRSHEPSFVMATAQAMIHRGDPIRAVGIVESALQRFPRDALLHGQLAIACEKISKAHMKPPVVWSSEADRFQLKAAHHYEIASNLKPDDYRFALSAGISAQELDRNRDAFTFFRRAAGAAPYLANAWVRLGNLYHRKENVPMARICFQNAVRAEPRERFAHLRLERMGVAPDRGGRIDFEPLGFIPFRAPQG